MFISQLFSPLILSSAFEKFDILPHLDSVCSVYQLDVKFSVQQIFTVCKFRIFSLSKQMKTTGERKQLTSL